MSKMLILGTRKGTLILDRSDEGWKARDICHPGAPVCYAARDPRTGDIWSALDHGHWGAKLSCSKDSGKTWSDAKAPAFPDGARYISKVLPTQDFDPDAPAGDPEYADAAVLKIWNITFGSADQPGRVYLGTIPGGLFVTDDYGQTWELNRPLWNHESRGGDLFSGDASSDNKWFGTPASVDYGVFEPGIHSIVVDPNDPQHLYLAVSSAGIIETTDGGSSWQPRNQGIVVDFLPDQTPDWGHDPHFITSCSSAPEHIWQQNHCGIYYSSDGAKSWSKVSDQKQGVHFGFPIAVDPRDGQTAWVVPANSDFDRTALNSRLCVARTTDGGKTWSKLTSGLPEENSFDVVLRHALDISGDVLCFGSSTGNLYLSEDRGDSWTCLGHNFPPIYSVRFG